MLLPTVNVPLEPIELAEPLAANVPTLNVPLLTIVLPEYVFAELLSVNAPVPTLVKEKVAPLITPLNVNAPVPPILLLLAKVIFPANDAVFVPIKAPLLLTPVPFKVIAVAPTAAPLISKVAPLATVALLAVAPRPFALVIVKVPALMLVVPT